MEISYKTYRKIGHPIVVKHKDSYYLGAISGMDVKEQEYISFTGGFDYSDGDFHKRFEVDSPVLVNEAHTIKDFNPNKGDFDFFNFPKDVKFYTKVFDLDDSKAVEIEARV